MRLSIPPGEVEAVPFRSVQSCGGVSAYKITDQYYCGSKCYEGDSEGKHEDIHHFMIMRMVL